jgi:hypothetical protein
MLLLALYSPLSFADPFVEWKGLPTDYFGLSYGIAVGDANGDGWTDLIAPYAQALWLNEAAKTWTFVEIPEFGEHFSQYGASFGDYNADGLPDIGTEPRGDDSLLFRNDGDGEFTPLDTDHFPIAPLGKGGWGGQQSETNSWVDADGDGFLDLFVPAYYGASGFYQNLGPDKSGEHVFEEMAVDIGIVLSPTGSLRPEGAQFIDIDRDGDPDLYVCGELLRNISTPGNPGFENGQGGIPQDGFDEGAAFGDIDMDGDFDLGVMYNGIYWTGSLGSSYGFLLWENMGDATFRMLDPETVDDWTLSGPGGVFGMSFADWDNDGDQDVTMAGRFEENQWREDGSHGFIMIDTDANQGYALPGWFDWDFDGDLDIGLGTWGNRARFFTNALYDATAEGDRHFLRVRPVADSALVEDGVDTEYGATVEVRVVGEAPEVRRVNFTASGHGYLNQSEYPLTFGLEGAPASVVDVSVDFVNPSDEGIWRVDKYVNPALGGIDVTTLALPREVRVFRSGAVRIGGTTYAPETDEYPLIETPGGLWAPHVDDEIAPVDAGTWVGLEVTVPEDKDPLRGAAIREVVVDGILGAPVKCGTTTGNVLVWDVTDEPRLVDGTTGAVLPYNRRVDVATDFELRNGRTYRVLALVTEARAYPVKKSSGWLEVEGALEFVPAKPCDATAMASPFAGSGDRSMAVRWRERVLEPPGPDTGDTGDTATDDTGKPTGDSGTAKDDSRPPIDAGRNDNYGDDEKSGGCGCASGTSPATGLWLLLGLPLVLRRRSSARSWIGRAITDE